MGIKQNEKTYAHGETCPECQNCKLEFDAGENDSRECPGYKASVFCPDCGIEFPMDAARVLRRQVAEQIAADLFTNGDGEKAQRLVSELSDGRDGGGWCESAVVDRVAMLLDKHGFDACP